LLNCLKLGRDAFELLSRQDTIVSVSLLGDAYQKVLLIAERPPKTPA
jgi:hypothetical protein